MFVENKPVDTLLRFFVYQIHFLRSFLCRPHTDRFPDVVLKKLWRNRNRDSCEKNATGTENTGIWRIPAGMCNLASRLILVGLGKLRFLQVNPGWSG
jgi:hypothetical protein